MRSFKNSKGFRGGIIIVLFILFTAGVGKAQPAVDQGFEILKNLDIFSSLFKEINTNYVDPISPGDLTKTAIDAMLESLDPYTNYIPESEIEDFKFITTGEYGGIGALIHQQGDFVVISEPYEGSPAQKNDLRAGDKIYEINGQSAKGKTYDAVSAILKGQAGTKLIMSVLRDGSDKPIEKNITREVIHIDNIPYSGIVGGNIAYIKLTSFTQNAANEVKQAFLKLREGNDIKGIIIDLRGNGGGLLNEAVDITNIFVDKGQDVVSTKGKLPDKNHTYKTMYSPVDTEIPLAVLVDGQSASASEILSGSLQDLDRGVIIGRRTFGKGLVQNVLPLTYNSQVKVTVAKYYIPSGRCIQRIDYSHKDKDGHFSNIPDSLITAFKTKAGRTVFEGRGISPDLYGKPIHYSNVALSLYSKFLIFDYASKFKREHASIPPADKFEISDTVYNDFLAYINGKDYSYKTKSEQALEDLRVNAEKEKYFDAIKKEYDDLKEQMINDKKGDLLKHKQEIKELIKAEIVTRYYFQKGKVQATLKSDATVDLAVKTLHDAEACKAILAGTYKTPKEQTETGSGTADDDESDSDEGD
jgi:carboxyl-terminal processing protease